VPAGEQSKTSRGPRALSSIDELLRRAAWDGLSDSERAGLLGAYPSFPTPASSEVSNISPDIRTSDLQDWVAALVAGSFQPEATQVVRSWLADGSPDAHLYLGGSIGQGRRSLVSALSRQAMTGRPMSPDYIYLPDPAALDQAYLLSLPRGTGKAFAKDIDLALRRITSAWSSGDGTEDTSDSSHNSSSNSSSSNNSPEKQEAPPPPLSQVTDQAFAQVESGAPSSARSYLASLRIAFSNLASRHEDLPASYDDMPTWLVRAPAGSDPFRSSSSSSALAPVVVGSLLRDKLDDLLVRANGGVLILPATDLIVVDGSWPNLSAALSTRSLQLKADWPAVPLSLRVALVGDGEAYSALSNAPGEFSRLFRYEVWCNDNVNWTNSSEATYAALANGVARRHGLPAFNASGVARLIEEGSRRVDGLNRTHLTTDLLLLHDLTLAAGHEAIARGASETTGEHVDAALGRRRSAYLVTATRVREAILSGQEITPTTGSAVGQVNGLGIFEFHPSEGNFAVPIRISATVSPGGEERVLDIEREADQADADHVRGEMTVEGYLAARYGKTRPINLVARIRFEQEHGTLGGDSASGALLYALLSALAEAPIRYSYSVTGAVGQYGELQPIGGVNTKIEGFWELCRLRRARGEQPEGGHGVIIPAINTRDLMLRPEVAQSIASEGWFHVWPASTVDEAMTLLTGIPAPQLHARVEKRLAEFHQIGARSRA
jgi:AAA domain/Lon protease (S16) C-terminal proteolytic domain